MYRAAYCLAALRSIALFQLPEPCGCDQSVRWAEFSITCYNGAVQRGIGTWSPVHWAWPLHWIRGELRVAWTRLQGQLSVPTNGFHHQWQSVNRSVKVKSCNSEFLADGSIWFVTTLVIRQCYSYATLWAMQSSEKWIYSSNQDK
jgi:hypothetical protein